MDSNNEWRKCSTCKKPIPFDHKYYVCSVSTCNGQRTGYVFCTVPCWDAHVPGARHRDAAAIEQRSEKKAGGAATRDPQRRIMVNGSTTPAPSGQQIPREILIVASKLKDYIRLRSDMNTSANVMEVLSEIVRRLCDDAIDKARQEGRKTVLDRDFKK